MITPSLFKFETYWIQFTLKLDQPYSGRSIRPTKRLYSPTKAYPSTWVWYMVCPLYNGPQFVFFPNMLTYFLHATWVTYNQLCFHNQRFSSKLCLAAKIRVWIWSRLGTIHVPCYFWKSPKLGKIPHVAVHPMHPCFGR